MKIREVSAGRACASALGIILMQLVAGCGLGSGGERAVASSGDPEADQRAEMRVGSATSGGAAQRTLYERLGGQPTIVALVDDMTERATADPRVNFARRD